MSAWIPEFRAVKSWIVGLNFAVIHIVFDETVFCALLSSIFSDSEVLSTFNRSFLWDVISIFDSFSLQLSVLNSSDMFTSCILSFLETILIRAEPKPFIEIKSKLYF